MQTTWNLNDLFTSDNDPAIELEKQKLQKQANDFVAKWEHRTDWLENATSLAQILTDYESWKADGGLYGKVGYYFFLRTSQNLLDSELKAKQNQINEQSTRIANQMQFVELRISNISKEAQQRFLTSSELAHFKHFLERIFAQKKHLLSEKEEKIVSSFAFHTEKWSGMVAQLLSKEEAFVDNKLLTFEEILAKTYGKSETTRDEAAKQFNQIILKHSDVAEHELNALLQHKKITDELRGFARADSARLFSDDINEKIVDTLLNTLQKNISISRDYYVLKAKLLGKQKLAYHERNVSYGSISKTYTFEEAVVILRRVFSKLGNEFLAIFNTYLEQGRIDAYPAKGKRGGAFMTADGGITNPIFILLNFTGSLQDVQTFAHEMGHACNYEMMKKTSNALTWETSYLTLESPSTFMEDFVSEDILAHTTDKEEKLSILMSKINTDVSTIFRQTSLYEFELELHAEFRKKGYLSRTEIGSLFQKHMANYTGEAVEQSEGSENWWIYVQHIRYMFYVYSYAAGLLISKSMQKRLKENLQFIEHIKQFYSSGMSKSPLHILQDALGIDATKSDVWQEGLDQTAQLLKQAQQLAKDLGHIE